MKNIIGILFLVIVLQSCISDTTTISNKKEVPVFFYLEAYFDSEIERLEEQKSRIKKRIKTLDKEETRNVQPQLWESELALFKKSAINKPAWQDKYEIDSIQENGLLEVRYKAKESDLYTQKIDVVWKNKAVHSIIIINTIKNEIYESQQVLTYIPQKEYSIKKIQNVALMDKDEYEIEAIFLP